MWLLVYHIAFRYKRPHASLLNAKAIRQSHSWIDLRGFQMMYRCSATHSARWWWRTEMYKRTLLGRVDLVFMPVLNSTAPII